MRTLLIDNYDSFTFNLFHLLGEVNGDEPIVVRNDELSWEEVAALAVDNVVISPGPGRPEHQRDVGVSLDVLQRAELPVLGVCLGHQALAHMTGGVIDHAPTVMHGRLSEIHHDGRRLFAGIPQGFAAVRYHSLAVAAVPATLGVTAWTPEGVVMGLEFDHPQGAKLVMKRLYEHGVWAIFSTLDPRVLQFKPGILLGPDLVEEILDRTAVAIGQAREDA